LKKCTFGASSTVNLFKERNAEIFNFFRNKESRAKGYLFAEVEVSL